MSTNCKRVIVLFLTVVSSSVPSNAEEPLFRNLWSWIMGPTVERIDAIEPIELGEGPHWDAETQSLYFVDIFGKAIHKYVPCTKKHTKAVIGKEFA